MICTNSYNNIDNQHRFKTLESGTCISLSIPLTISHPRFIQRSERLLISTRLISIESQPKKVVVVLWLWLLFLLLLVPKNVWSKKIQVKKFLIKRKFGSNIAFNIAFNFRFNVWFTIGLNIGVQYSVRYCVQYLCSILGSILGLNIELIPAQRRRGHSLTACNAAPRASWPQNGRRGLERCLPLGFGALPPTFAK